MKTLLLSLLAAATFVGCGASPCERYNSTSDSFFSGKTECAYTEGGATITMTKKALVCGNLSACTADDLKAMDTYADCLDKATKCTAGNEKAATSGGLACILTLAGSVSTACGTALQ